jgi:hypothetical protein
MSGGREICHVVGASGYPLMYMTAGIALSAHPVEPAPTREEGRMRAPRGLGLLKCTCDAAQADGPAQPVC